MTNKQILKYLQNLESKLYASPQRRIQLTLEWKKSFPTMPGVYGIFKSRQLIYVGETGNISQRMNDLRNTKNHTLSGIEYVTGKDDFLFENTNFSSCDFSQVKLPFGFLFLENIINISRNFIGII